MVVVVVELRKVARRGVADDTEADEGVGAVGVVELGGPLVAAQ